MRPSSIASLIAPVRSVAHIPSRPSLFTSLLALVVHVSLMATLSAYLLARQLLSIELQGFAKQALQSRCASPCSG
ncbi:hypothetical protein A4X03_0g9684 [Tilletia caries]|uniref:Uncharacterized protein n=1 Tax=Tilletia caries TaxID=13290 RepID=A0A177TEY9_9BASI|nr:hypothetical protein A4X03_0g9684 [Tilletia caries]